MSRPLVGIPTGLGLNSHEELGRCFNIVGADVEFTHLNDWIANPDMLDRYQGFGLPGGFSMGDHLGAGQSLANRMELSGLRAKLQTKVDDFSKPVYCVCNFKQVFGKTNAFPIEVGTLQNDSGKHETGFWDLELNKDNPTVWLDYLREYYGPFFAPISHGEGRVFVPNVAAAQPYVALRYTRGTMSDFYRNSRNGRYNPNGSTDDIAGFGWANNLVLFPHFERLILNVQRPDRASAGNPHGFFEPTYLLFKAAVDYMKKQ